MWVSVAYQAFRDLRGVDFAEIPTGSQPFQMIYNGREDLIFAVNQKNKMISHRPF